VQILSLTLIILGTMLIRTTLIAELSRSVPHNRQGMIMGLNQSLMSGANIIAPILSGALIDRRLYDTWAFAMAAIAACGAITAFGLLAPPQAKITAPGRGVSWLSPFLRIVARWRSARL
jgi:MFS family permease